jgi:hypothetical protein
MHTLYIYLKFYHCTTKGKRALLMTLAPLLTEAEKQRQADTLACEYFTQCKAVKIKGRGSYEYYTITSNLKVPHVEYEKR